MEKEGSPLIINKQMWETLGHYWDPYEVSLFDEDYKLHIGNITYKVDKNAIYKKEPRGDFEMTIYYGDDGYVHSDEVQFIYQNSDNLEEIANYDFKSPAAKELFIEEKKSTSSRTYSISHGFHILSTSNFAGSPTSLSSGSPYEVRYFSDAGYLTRANLAVFYWNAEYRDFGGRGEGGTVLLIRDIDRNENYLTNRWVMPSSNGYVLYAGQTRWSASRSGTGIPISNRESVKPYTFVKVYARKWREDFGSTWYAYRGSVPRRNGQNASSRHKVDFRRNDSSTNTEVFHISFQR
ncbi:MAG: hypothetical protein GDA51_00610 [Ekhidna sp.]|nr:hypothetical protein [Ekhidna sp.]